MAAGIYKDDPNWIRPLDKDIEEVFDPAKNKFFNDGECARWLLGDDAGNVIGRIAAFVSQKYIRDQEQPTGGIGFLEWIKDIARHGFWSAACRLWTVPSTLARKNGGGACR